MRAASLLAAASLATAALALAACGSHDTGTASVAPPPEDPLLPDLRRFETERRAATDFAQAPPSDHLFGADPYVIRAAGPDRFIGLLRGADALVLLDRELREVARADAPPSPSGLAVTGDTAFVVGERASEIRVYTWSRDRLSPRLPLPLFEARGLRDIAAGPDGTLYAVEEVEGRLFTLTPRAVPSPPAHAPPSAHAPSPTAPARSPGHAAPEPYDVTTTVACPGAFRVARTPSAVLVDCLLAHTILAYRVDARGRPQPDPAVLRNDGPLWSFAALEDPTGLLVASGGAEDKPLDRTHGSFENVDSFVYLDRIRWSDASPPTPTVTRLAEVNLSAHGVVLPKALDLARNLPPGDAGLTITATGYGGEAFASILLREAPSRDGAPPGAPPDLSAPEVIAHALPPGTSSFTFDANDNMILANPLLDAWILYRTEHLPGLTVPVPDPRSAALPKRTPASRIGEALIFTTLIAPWNRADGPLSRFTCETCHFEGYVDGRTHATGRGDVRATTKPLLGLWSNGPHFSRALDPDLASVAQNEFRVANARSGHDPVFDLAPTEHPWLTDLGATSADLTAPALRRAFMTFLMEWSHRPSALTSARTSFTPTERRGAELFRDRCETCHEARFTTDPTSPRVPFDAWEPNLFSAASPIVWAQARYAKTGVTPYVHDRGARVPSLRRLYKKHPYFTNGSAKTLADLLARARFTPDAFFHDAAPADAHAAAFTDDERAALEAFLRLL